MNTDVNGAQKRRSRVGTQQYLGGKRLDIHCDPVESSGRESASRIRKGWFTGVGRCGGAREVKSLRPVSVDKYVNPHQVVGGFFKIK